MWHMSLLPLHITIRRAYGPWVGDRAETCDLSVLRTSEMSADLLLRVRRLLASAFGPEFTDDDWHHALGGWHVLAVRDQLLVSHAAVVARELHIGAVAVHAGYVEAVATDPRRQGQGFGTRVMLAAAEVLKREFDMGVLSTGAHGFYARLGWERWVGPTHVRRPDGVVHTPDEDDGIMALRFGAARCPLSLPISCEGRAGDDW